jgi:hypothetical protein
VTLFLAAENRIVGESKASDLIQPYTLLNMPESRLCMLSTLLLDSSVKFLEGFPLRVDTCVHESVADLGGPSQGHSTWSDSVLRMSSISICSQPAWPAPELKFKAYSLPKDVRGWVRCRLKGSPKHEDKAQYTALLVIEIWVEKDVKLTC